MFDMIATVFVKEREEWRVHFVVRIMKQSPRDVKGMKLRNASDHIH